MDEGQKCSFPGCENPATCTCDNCGKSYCQEHCNHDPDSHSGGMICADCQAKRHEEDKSEDSSESGGEQPDGQ